jgi:hypothetical protein
MRARTGIADDYRGAPPSIIVVAAPEPVIWRLSDDGNEQLRLTGQSRIEVSHSAENAAPPYDLPKVGLRDVEYPATPGYTIPTATEGNARTGCPVRGELTPVRVGVSRRVFTLSCAATRNASLIRVKVVNQEISQRPDSSAVV